VRGLDQFELEYDTGAREPEEEIWPARQFSDWPTAEPELEGGLVGGALQRLRDAQARFENAFFQMQQLPPEAKADPEYIEVMDRAWELRDMMQSIAERASAAFAWAKSIFGLSGLRRGLGVLPAVPLTYAAITAAVALVIASANSMMQFVVNWRRAEEGKPPVPGSGGGMGETLREASGLVKWLAIGAVIYYAAPPILRAIEKRRA
jgi:hypothetical protein